MSDNGSISMSKHRVVSLERLENRIFHAMLSTPIPDLSLDEIVALRNGAFMDVPQAKKDPKQIVTGWCEAEKSRIVYFWEYEQQYVETDLKASIPGAPPDTSLHDELIARIKSWTMLEALKVVKIFEDIDALDLTALRLTPEGIYKLLEDTRANSM